MTNTFDVIQTLVNEGATLLSGVFEVRITGPEPGRSEWVDKVVALLSTINGGASVASNVGTWEADDRIGTEPSILISVNCKDPAYNLVSVGNMLINWMDQLNQTHVWFRLDDHVFIASRSQLGGFMWQWMAFISKMEANNA